MVLENSMMLDHADYTPLQPKYQRHEAPAIPLKDIVVEGSQFDFKEIVSQNADGGWDLLRETAEAQRLKGVLQERFADKGVFLLRDTGLTKMDPTGAAAAIIPDLLSDATKYVGGSNFRETLAPNVYDTGAPMSAHLHYHHEMEYVADSINTIRYSIFALDMWAATGV
jgi:hypothetical protein